MPDRRRMNFKPVWLVASRELHDQLRDWRFIFPLIILTLILPFLANLGAQAAINFTTRYGTPLIAERLVPFLLMVVGYFPITVSLVISLEAFVGEKERGTIEPLLVTPLEDWQIYLGKLIAGTVAPLGTSYLGITIYLLGLQWRQIQIPSGGLILQMLVLTTVQALLMVSAAILISTQATSVRSANLMASFIVIPIAILIQGESIMLFWGNDRILWLAVAGVSILTALLIRMGIAHFQREFLLGREIDFLNLRWIVRKLFKGFHGGARNLWDWYRRGVLGAVRRQMTSIFIVILVGAAAITAGVFLFDRNAGMLQASLQNESLSQYFPSSLGIPASPAEISFSTLLSHNLRALLVIGLLGMFSFSVLGTAVYILNMGIIGSVLALVKAAGGSPLMVTIFGILPHGVFELAGLILFSACMFHGGIMLVTPRLGKTLGEAMIENLSDWLKITIGLVIPLISLAALVESSITPMLLSAVVN